MKSRPYFILRCVFACYVFRTYGFNKSINKSTTHIKPSAPIKVRIVSRLVTISLKFPPKVIDEKL